LTIPISLNSFAFAPKSLNDRIVGATDRKKRLCCSSLNDFVTVDEEGEAMHPRGRTTEDKVTDSISE
jgi:hypothetical protein